VGHDPSHTVTVRVCRHLAVVSACLVWMGLWLPSAAGASVTRTPASISVHLLPSDGWTNGHGGREIFGGTFHAALTPSGACAWMGGYNVLWPAGYHVRFHPTELLNPKGKVVAREGQFVAAGGQLVGTASWPSASRCYKGGDLVASQAPVLAGKRVGPLLF
jgi:hypothetical protein